MPLNIALDNLFQSAKLTFGSGGAAGNTQGTAALELTTSRS